MAERCDAITSAAIKSRARELGFDACGIARADAYPELQFFDEWLARGYDGEMAYLREHLDWRRDVRTVVRGARSVVVTATLYNTKRPYSTEVADPAAARISRYAWGDDYHVIVKKRLEALLAWMHEVSPERFAACPYVDTGPVVERVYARHAGIGWIGKNSCVINADLGSWLFLSEIICTLELEPDQAAFDQCGTCTLCLEACPTQAIVAPGQVDARRCLSYLTIEKRGEIPAEFHEAIGSHLYGCDICQDVCPWNQLAPASDDPAWQPRGIWDGATIEALSAKTDDDLRAGITGTAMQRAKVAGLRRNLAIAASNAARAAPAAAPAGFRSPDGALPPHGQNDS